MGLHRSAALLMAVASMVSCTRPADTSTPSTIIGRPIRVDADRKLLPWPVAPSPFAHVAWLAWNALETRFPVQDNGLPTYMAYSRFDPDEFWGVSWPHNPAGLYAMLADSATLWYAYSGDEAAIALVRRLLDYQLDHGTTPDDWDWAKVPFSSANPGDADYRGADDAWCNFCGRGDGTGVLEPDKVGELGGGYLQFFELTGDERYRDAAIACADALAKHERDGDEAHSPWPFRVYAQTNVSREEYSADVIAPIVLFDELVRLRLGDVDAYTRARGQAFDWLMRVPITNDAWSGYFEDIEIQVDPAANPNQYIAMRTARWLLQHPDADPRWRDHVAHLLAWVEQTFGVDTANERGNQWGATVLSEQFADMAKMGSHTARFGATTALWWEATGDAPALDRAARSLAWATYTCDDRGIVTVGEDKNEGWWFSDGYGDYIRHFLVAMGAVPDWAPPAENHVLRSTSVVSSVDYAPEQVTWTTFDADATDTLRLVSRPARVTSNGVTLAERPSLDEAGYLVRSLRSGGVAVQVRHTTAGAVVVTTSRASMSPENGPSEGAWEAGGPGPGGRCSFGRSGSAGGLWGSVGVLGLALSRRRRSAKRRSE